MHLFFNRSVLPIGTHLLLPMAPEVIQRVQIGASDRQPHQSDPQDPHHASRHLGDMTTVPVQHERHLPSPVPLMDQSQELLEVSLPLLLPLQEQPCSALGVEGAEDHALRVGSA